MNKLRHWIIEDGKVRGATFPEWAAFFETCCRHVGDTKVGDIRISTVFLGIDHSFSLRDDEPPILFETMIFDKTNKLPALHPGLWSENMWRYLTLAQAEKGHKLAIDKVREFYPDAKVTDEMGPEKLGETRAGEQVRRWEIEKELREKHL